jgi:hypothetical protein
MTALNKSVQALTAKLTAKRNTGEKTQRTVAIMAATLTGGMIALCYLLTRSTAENGEGGDLGVGVAAFLLFVAAGTVGAVLGFLFGLPRSRFADLATAADLVAPQPATPNPTGAPTAPTTSTRYLTNSNLIKVSDWLTTIVIGLSLVNLGKALPALRSLSAALKAPLGGAAYAGAIGTSVLIVGSLAGFMLSYLWTSTRFRELLEEFERQLEKVPDFIGRTMIEAKGIAAVTAIKMVPPKDARDEDQICSQSIPAGTNVPRGTEMKVSIAPDTSESGAPRPHCRT